MRNEKLRSALMELFNRQYEAAEALRIDYSRLSGIIGGYRRPTRREREELERVLGKRKVKRILQNEPRNHHAAVARWKS